MRRIVSQSLNSVQVVKDEGEVVEMSKDLVRHETRCYVPVGRGSHVGIYCYRKTNAVAEHDAFRALGSNSVLKRIPLFFFRLVFTLFGEELEAFISKKKYNS